MNNFRDGLLSPFNKCYMSGDLDKVVGFIREMCLDRRYKQPILKRLIRSGGWWRSAYCGGVKYDLRVIRGGDTYTIVLKES